MLKSNKPQKFSYIVYLDSLLYKFFKILYFLHFSRFLISNIFSWKLLMGLSFQELEGSSLDNMTSKERCLSSSQILVQDNPLSLDTYRALFLFAKVLFVWYGIPLSYNHIHQAKNTSGESPPRSVNQRYVCHHQTFLVNKWTSSPLELFKQELVRFLSNADDNCQVWLVPQCCWSPGFHLSGGISAVYFMTFHYNIKILGDRFYVLYS